MLRRKSWILGVLLGALVLLSTLAYARTAWVEGGIWEASELNDCASEGLICADWDIQGIKGPNCCIVPGGLHTSDPDACVSRLRHSHDG